VRNKRFFLLFLILLSLAKVSISQITSVSGKVVEKFSKTPQPFTHIIVNENELELLSDEDGSFSIHHNKEIKTLKFKHYLYRDLNFKVENNSDSLTIELQKYTLFSFEDRSDLHTARIIYNALLARKKNDTETNTPHSFNTYNKLTVETNRLQDTKKMLEKNLKILGIKLKPFSKDHNLFMIESVTEKRYFNDLNQKEDIISSKVSGIDETSIYTISSLLLPGSIYKNYISLATLSYLSPLNEKALTNYHFKILDTVNINNENTYIIKFTPARKNTDALKGLLFINSSSYSVTNFVLSPAYDSPPFEIIQSYSKHEGKWFPNVTWTNYLAKNYGRDNIRINLSARTYRGNLLYRKDYSVFDFDDVILKYKKSANNQDEQYWEAIRREELTEKDKNTYSFFDTIGSIKRFERYSRLGEGVYNGIIPVRILNLQVGRFLSANEYEGFRIGAGVETNNLLSDRYAFGGYVGYGTRDQVLKYGVNGRFVMDKESEFTFYSSIYSDLKESGGVAFSFDRDQFSTESLRKYRLTILDRVMGHSYEASIKPIRYLYISTALNLEDLHPTYYYQYKEDFVSQYHFAEFKLGMKIAFGEQFIRSPQNKFGLPPKYPIFWLEYKKGLNDVFFGEYNYNKWDLKVQYSLKKPGLGKQSIQITGGVARGDLPYSKLYNMEGSWRTFSVVVHNSFESMRYNEFLSDKYLAIHFAQDLGKKVLFERPWIAPGVEILHSFGIGSLKNKEEHQGISFKTMEKGYFESGVFVYDLFTLRTLGLKTGIGTGIFARYGPYAKDKFIDNFVYKLGLSFNL
jgi:hypothetical protein